MISNRSGDCAGDQEAQRPAHAVTPPRELELETLARERRRQQKGRRLALARRARHVHRRNSGYGRQRADTGEPPRLRRGAMLGRRASDHALAFEPINAGFQPRKIVVAVDRVGARPPGCLPVPAIGCPGRAKVVGLGIKGVRRVSQWGNHARRLLSRPIRLPLWPMFPDLPQCTIARRAILRKHEVRPRATIPLSFPPQPHMVEARQDNLK